MYRLLMTGERYSPGSLDLCTGYEHIHRYLFSIQYTRGKKVLDLACGEGYGSALLAQSASEVIGIDICPEAVTQANAVYQNKNLSFRVGSMECVPLDVLFDVIVCFEAIEHISNHDLLCKEVKRLLQPNGIFIVSTPNKWVYSEDGVTKNPYHMKELDLTELQTLLTRDFRHQYIYGQKTVTSSRVFPLHSSTNTVQEKRIQMRVDGFCVTDQEDPLPRYFIALASDQRVEACEGVSYLTDVAARKGFAQWTIPKEASWMRRYILRALLKWFIQ